MANSQKCSQFLLPLPFPVARKWQRDLCKLEKRSYRRCLIVLRSSQKCSQFVLPLPFSVAILRTFDLCKLERRSTDAALLCYGPQYKLYSNFVFFFNSFIPCSLSQSLLLTFDLYVQFCCCHKQKIQIQRENRTPLTLYCIWTLIDTNVIQR